MAIFEFSSAFDLHRRVDLNKRLDFIGQVFELYCIDYIHDVVEDADFWSDYTTTIQYPKKIDCTEAEMKAVLRNFYPKYNKQWPKYMSGKNQEI